MDLKLPEVESGGAAKEPEEWKPSSPEDAFFKSGLTHETEWNGKPVKLRPLDGWRVRAADAMGINMFQMGAEESAEMRSSGFWDGMVNDVTLICCLCAQGEDWAKQACLSPRRYKLEALEWGNGHGIYLGGSAYEAALEFFLTRIAEIEASMAEVDETGRGGGGEESLGESSAAA